MKSVLLLIFFTLTLLGPLPALSEPTGNETRLATEVARLTSVLENLSQQLDNEKQQRENDVRFRKLELAIAYLNFRSRRIESLERNIDNQRSIRSRIEENLPIVAERIRDIELRMQEYPQGAPEELTEARDDLLTQQTLFRERIARIDDDLVMKENLMYELRNQISDVEAYVQRHLEM